MKRQIPPVRTQLTGTFFGKEYHATIVAIPGGSAVQYDGKLYQSLSGAAKAITKNPVNGWLFWHF